MGEKLSNLSASLHALLTSIARLWRSKDDLSFSHIRKAYLAFFFLIPLTYLLNYFHYWTDVGVILGISSQTWMLWARAVGWIACLLYPKSLKLVLKASVVVSVIGMALLWILPVGQARIITSVIYQGSTAGIDLFSYFIFLYILNNSERMLGLIICMTAQGLYRAMDPWVQPIHRNALSVIMLALIMLALYFMQKSKLYGYVDAAAAPRRKIPKGALIASLPLAIFFLVDVFFAIRAGFLVEFGVRPFYGAGILLGVMIIIVAQYLLHNSAWHSWNLFLLITTAAIAIIIPEPVTLPVIGAFVCGAGLCVGNITTNYMLGGVAGKYAHPIFFRLLCGIMVLYYLVGTTAADLLERMFPAQFGYINFGVSLGFMFISVVCSPLLYKNLFSVRWTDKKRPLYSFEDFSLTAREKELAVLLLSGEAQKNIAVNMGVSYSTVRFHSNNLYRKLNIQSRAELFALFSASTPEESDRKETGLYQ